MEKYFGMVATVSEYIGVIVLIEGWSTLLLLEASLSGGFEFEFSRV